LERTKTDLCEVVALRKGDEDDEQMDEVEVEDEIEERDAAEDEEEAGYGVRFCRKRGYAMVRTRKRPPRVRRLKSSEGGYLLTSKKERRVKR